jgi:hypothetical protein
VKAARAQNELFPEHRLQKAFQATLAVARTESEIRLAVLSPAHGWSFLAERRNRVIEICARIAGRQNSVNFPTLPAHLSKSPRRRHLPDDLRSRHCSGIRIAVVVRDDTL